MSGITMTTNELLHANYQAATTSVVSASAVTITAGVPEFAIPAGFMVTTGKRSSSIVLDIGGYLTATAVVPTWSFGIGTQIATSAPTFGSGNPLVTATTAVAPTAGSGSWNLHLKIGLRTLAVGAGSTLWASGVVTSNLFAAAPVMFNPGGSGGTTMVIYQSDAGYYLWPFLTLGAATAGNTVTTQYTKLYGEN